MELEQKLKVALDESRLLILGAQVLFGFQFQAAFQQEFDKLAPASLTMHACGAALLLVSICLLIAPSLHHQIVYDGESRGGALAAATGFAGASLLPLTLGLGASTFVVFNHLFGRGPAIALALGLTIVGTGLLYGLGFALKSLRKDTPMQIDERATSTKTKIEQMLTEARVLIPGAQALLGFQLIATLTTAFRQLPELLRYVHAGALCAIALAAMLLMTPAAVHRIAFQGEDDPTFFRIGSALVIASAVPLAIGISADIAVVFYRIDENPGSSLGAGLAALVVLLAAWFVYPCWRRARMENSRRAHPSLQRP